MVPSNLGEEMSTEVTLPPEWEDDERMNFLFSDFKENRDVNTKDWDSKIDFWTSLILKICRSRGTVCFNLQELNKIFQRKGFVPLGLGTVIQCMARCGKIQRESEFAANVDCGWVSWGFGLLLVKPLKWTFSTLLGSSGVTLEESFVVIELVKEKAAELLGVYWSSPVANCSLLSFQELQTLSSHVCIDESTLCMALLQQGLTCPYRISFSCLPASWHFSLSPLVLPRLLLPSFRQLLLFGLLVGLLGLLYLLLVTGKGQDSWIRKDNYFHRHLARVTDVEATDTSNPNLNYGLVVDCGSSGSRVFVYCWPQHNGNPHDLLDIRQMRDQHRKPVVMKIKPGISELAKTPEKASDYIHPLLSFAAQHIPKHKHQETPLYILCTAGMRVLSDSQQEALLEDLRTDIPVQFNFLFSDSHVEVISGKQEGVYAWIGINFVLGRFNHVSSERDAVVEVQVPGGDQQEALVRRRTAGVLDMGGVSTQIAYEVPKTVSFASPQQEEVAKNLLAEFNLGCDAHRTEHVYRVYVSTFLGFGGNAARQRYEESIVRNTLTKNKLLGQHVGETAESPLLDPCLPTDLQDEVGPATQKLYLRGTGDFDHCRQLLQPFLNRTNETHSSLNGIYQPPIDYPNSQFYGFSEFYYCTEDVLRMGGDFNSSKYSVAAKGYCATQWRSLKERFDSGLYASHADVHRLKYQCFKSAWMYEVFHSGFSFPIDYKNLRTALLVYDKEVQWTLGAILYRTRFLPLRDIQQETLKGVHAHWRHSFSFVNNHYLFLACFLVVLLSILLYLLRLRRIHSCTTQRCTPSTVEWLEEGLGSPSLPITL